MKIQYDHQIFTMQQYGGISRYFYELIKRFEGTENSCDVALLLSNNAYYNQEVDPKVSPFFPNSNSRITGKIFRTVNQQISSYVEKKGDFDVFHPTYYNDSFIEKIKKKPFVVTFYDMIHEKFSGQFEGLKLDAKIFDSKRRLLEHSNRIIAISETTKRDIMDIYDVDSSKIDVVYLGNSLEHYTKEQQRLVEQDYVLFVGNRFGYKNFERFVSSIADLLIDNSLKLVCAGGVDFTPDEQSMFQSLHIENIVEFKKITNDAELSNYYAHALFFVFPSLYEGFGIPVLESFACNCPALLSNGGSLKEIGGDAAEYFDPMDSHSIHDAVFNLIKDQTLRQNLKEKGAIRLNEFSWDKTFLNTLDVYKSVL